MKTSTKKYEASDYTTVVAKLKNGDFLAYKLEFATCQVSFIGDTEAEALVGVNCVCDDVIEMLYGTNSYIPNPSPPSQVGLFED